MCNSTCSENWNWLVGWLIPQRHNFLCALHIKYTPQSCLQMIFWSTWSQVRAYFLTFVCQSVRLSVRPDVFSAMVHRTFLSFCMKVQEGTKLDFWKNPGFWGKVGEIPTFGQKYVFFCKIPKSDPVVFRAFFGYVLLVVHKFFIFLSDLEWSDLIVYQQKCPKFGLNLKDGLSRWFLDIFFNFVDMILLFYLTQHLLKYMCTKFWVINQMWSENWKNCKNHIL